MEEESFETVDDPGEQASPQTDRPTSGRRRLRLRRRRAELITDARRSPAENLRHRERAYSWLQAARLPALLISAGSYLWLGDWILSGVLFLISIPLPWIAVVIANGKGEPRDKRSPTVYKPQAARVYNQMLEDEAARRAALTSGPVRELTAGSGEAEADVEAETIEHVVIDEEPEQKPNQEKETP